MTTSTPGRSLSTSLVLIVGVVLLLIGLYAIYFQVLPRPEGSLARRTSDLLCKIYPPTGYHPFDSTAPSGSDQVTQLSGATLKLTAPAKARLDETVTVDLCVDAKPELPAARRQALLQHLLVRLSGVGLQIDPHQKIPALVSSDGCLGTAAWTVRANSAGHYTAVVNPESTDQEQSEKTASAKPRWDFALQQPAEVEIQFQPAWTDYVQKSWGVVSTVLGTLLVLIQVLQNLRQRKKTTAA